MREANVNRERELISKMCEEKMMNKSSGCGKKPGRSDVIDGWLELKPTLIGTYTHYQVTSHSASLSHPQFI